MAFTNCPNVKELANLSPLTMLEISGLRDTCINVLPIPNNENEISIPAYEWLITGTINARTVTTRLSNTVFFLPIRFINIPVGTENIKNQKKTIEGNIIPLMPAGGTYRVEVVM